MGGRCGREVWEGGVGGRCGEGGGRGEKSERKFVRSGDDSHCNALLVVLLWIPGGVTVLHVSRCAARLVSDHCNGHLPSGAIE